MADVFVRLPQLREDFGNPGKSTVRYWVKEGLLTPPVLIGIQSKAWPKSEVERIRAARIAGQTPDQIRALVAQMVAARSSIKEAA